MIILRVLVAVFALNIVFSSTVDAYIDPNTGGFFFQTVAPFVYGILGVIVVFWKRITGYVKGLFCSKKDPNNHSENE